jgi:hypothetical protein
MNASYSAVPLAPFLGLLLLGSPISVSRGQNRWDRYKPGTISTVIQQHDSSIRASSAGRLPSWVITGEQFPTMARVVYRGDSRPVDSIRAELVRRWGMSFLRDSSIARRFRREYLFQEGQNLLWLPVQDTVASYFPRELHPGQEIALYVLWFGAYYAGRDITWAFVVTEFDARSAER